MARSFNRNFKGRSGTADDSVYLASPETCAATGLHGAITDPRKLGEPITVSPPPEYLVDDNMIVPPPKDAEVVEVIRGPNIKPVPVAPPLPDALRGQVLLKVGDNITTDHIMPAGAQVLPLRSNIPAIAEYVFWRVDAGFVQRAKDAKEQGGGMVVGGVNYGQGSSREHAALAPMHLGLKAVIVKSYARIHHANLINVGILPLNFGDETDFDALEQGDEWEIVGVRDALRAGQDLTIRNLSKGTTFTVTYNLTERQVKILLVGGTLNYIKSGGK